MSRINWKLEVSLGHLLTALLMVVSVVVSYTATTTKMEVMANEQENLRLDVRGMQADAPAMEGRLTRIETNLENYNNTLLRIEAKLDRN